MRKFLIFLAAIFLVMSIGCATLDSLQSLIAVDITTRVVLDKYPQWADEISYVCDNAIKAIDAGLIENVDQLEVWIRDYVNWNSLVPSEKAIVDEFIKNIIMDIKANVPDMDEQDKASIEKMRTVLVLIKELAEQEINK